MMEEEYRLTRRRKGKHKLCGAVLLGKIGSESQAKKSLSKPVPNNQKITTQREPVSFNKYNSLACGK